MGVTARHAIDLKLIDDIIPEPLGGAHRDKSAMCSAIKENLIKNLTELEQLSKDDLLEQRYQRLISYGLQH